MELDPYALSFAKKKKKECLTVHPPNLDLPIIGPRDDEGHGGVESRPVYPTIMSLKKKERKKRRTASKQGLTSSAGKQDYCMRCAVSTLAAEFGQLKSTRLKIANVGPSWSKTGLSNS